MQDECNTTRNPIMNYTLDIKLVKAHLLNSGTAAEFPNVEWKLFLLGQSLRVQE